MISLTVVCGSGIARVRTDSSKRQPYQFLDQVELRLDQRGVRVRICSFRRLIVGVVGAKAKGKRSSHWAEGNLERSQAVIKNGAEGDNLSSDRFFSLDCSNHVGEVETAAVLGLRMPIIHRQIGRMLGAVRHKPKIEVWVAHEG
jgi:hypothetical protein